jgi:hypothetical protein
VHIFFSLSKTSHRHADSCNRTSHRIASGCHSPFRTSYRLNQFPFWAQNHPVCLFTRTQLSPSTKSSIYLGSHYPTSLNLNRCQNQTGFGTSDRLVLRRRWDALLTHPLVHHQRNRGLNQNGIPHRNMGRHFRRSVRPARKKRGSDLPSVPIFSSDNSALPPQIPGDLRREADRSVPRSGEENAPRRPPREALIHRAHSRLGRQGYPPGLRRGHRRMGSASRGNADPT